MKYMGCPSGIQWACPSWAQVVEWNLKQGLLTIQNLCRCERRVSPKYDPHRLSMFTFRERFTQMSSGWTQWRINFSDNTTTANGEVSNWRVWVCTFSPWRQSLFVFTIFITSPRCSRNAKINGYKNTDWKRSETSDFLRWMRHVLDSVFFLRVSGLP